MEFLIKAFKTKKQYNLAESLISKEQLQQTIGRDFNKSIANILGLVSLLDENSASDRDFEDIRRYLSTEATNLDVMVKKLCA